MGRGESGRIATKFHCVINTRALHVGLPQYPLSLMPSSDRLMHAGVEIVIFGYLARRSNARGVTPRAPVCEG